MLNLKTLVCLYQKLLDCLNIIYIVALIISSGFKNFHFLILLKINNISNIEKTMIFIDSIEKDRALIIYLQTLLSGKLKNKGENIIKSFLWILEATTKTDWLEKFFTNNTKIMIYTDAAKMEINISNIKHII